MQLNFLSAVQQQLLINQNLILVQYAINPTVLEESTSGRIRIDLGYLACHMCSAVQLGVLLILA